MPKKKTKKPLPFLVRGASCAECDSYPSGRRVVIDFLCSLDGDTSSRFARWMMKAAAWVAEDPKRGRNAR